LREFIINIVKGILIGIANIIPGLSGSTLALILGIYEKMITILTKVDLQLFQLIKGLNFKAIKKHISLKFLAPIMIGIMISFVSLAHLLQYLFNHFAIYTWSYFFGIILASIFYVSKYTNKWRKTEFLYFTFGLMVSLILFLLDPNMQENRNLFFVFVCGVIGVAGMLLPGLSGSYLLVLLGNYKLLISDTLHYLTEPAYYNNDEFYMYLNLFVIFLLGHICGLLLFSRLIKWLITNHKNITFAMLTGFITGSLLSIWPWKKPSIINDSSSSLFQQIGCPDFNNITDLYAIIIILLGAITIVIIEKLANKYKNV